MAVRESLWNGLLLHALAPTARIAGRVGGAAEADAPPEDCHDSWRVRCLTGLAGACWTRLDGLRGCAMGARLG